MLRVFRLRQGLTRAISTLVLVTVATTPAATFIRTSGAIIGLMSVRGALAGGIEAGAAAGQQSAIELSSDFVLPTYSDGALSIDNGMSTSITVDQSELFPGSTSGDLNTYTSTYGSDSDMWNLGVDAQEALAAETSPTGDAYRVLEEQAAAPKPDLRNDPLWTLTDDTLSSLDLLKDQFSDCKATTTYAETDETVHVPDYKFCTRVEDHSASCELRHSYDVNPILEVTEGPLNRSSCGEGCLDIWIGEVGDNYWSGTCKIYNTVTKLEIKNPQAITSAKLKYAKWDDYLLITLDGSPIYAGPYGGDRLSIYDPPCQDEGCWYQVKQVEYKKDTRGPCELSTSWEKDLNVGVTSHFTSLEPGDILTFRNRVEVTGGGEGYARIRIQYDPAKVITDGSWYPQECVDLLQYSDDGFCSVDYSCTRKPNYYSNGCITVSATKVCNDTARSVFDVPAGFNPTPFCTRADVALSCSDFYKGQMSCWVDPQGVEHCPTNEGGNLEQCAELEQDPACAYMGRECVDGAQTEDGTCYVWTEKYDCGYDTTYSTLDALTSYDCDGPVSCFGTDCIDPAFESSSSFAKALAATQAAEFMAMDLSCTDVSGTENVVCSVFDGKVGKCKVAVGGIVDCCERPSGISLANYINFILSARKLDSMLTSPGLADTAIQGAWQTLREPVTSTWTEIKKPFSEAWSSLMGKGATEGVGAAAQKSAIEKFQSDVTTKVAEWVGDQFGPAVQKSLFVPAEGGGFELGGTVGTTLQYVYYAYMIYMMVMLIIQLIWECEEAEFELGAQRELRNCHYIGSYCSNDTFLGCIEKTESYCCFNSPLSRIIQEQVRPQLNMSWGSPETPQCNGIPTGKLEAVDWSDVDLSEWLGILNITGNLKTKADLDMDALTGSGNLWSAGTGHLDAATRAEKRLEGIDTTEIRQSARDEL